MPWRLVEIQWEDAGVTWLESMQVSGSTAQMLADAVSSAQKLINEQHPTWVDPEIRALPRGGVYSGRRAKVRMPDGTLRKAHIGLPDIKAAIPARVRLHRKTLKGVVRVRERDNIPEYYFVPAA